MRIAGALLLLVSAAACGGDDSGDGEECTGHTCPIEVPFDDYVTGDEIVGSTSVITRTADAVSTTSHMVFPADQEGMVYTYWYFIFDSPSMCTINPCDLEDFTADRGSPSGIHFGGFVVDSTLEYDFEQTRTVADGVADPAKGDIVPGEEPHGLTAPMNAEVHILLRSHGPELDDFDAQVATMDGGCPPNTCENMFFVIHRNLF